jgi:feruloyl-CoA synthase
MTPVADRYEIRARGASITPGYWRDAEATRTAFDEEGWYCMGDAVRFAEAEKPLEGLVYDGRLSENFKLASGTWVAVSPLRALALGAFAPLVGDVVITGHSEKEVGLVLFPILENCRELPGCGAAKTLGELLETPAFRRSVQDRLETLSRQGNSSTTRITRAVVIAEEPSAIEITDKKTLSFASVLRRREQAIKALYRGETGYGFFYVGKADLRSDTAGVGG